jgi:hypothetical protein
MPIPNAKLLRARGLQLAIGVLACLLASRAGAQEGVELAVLPAVSQHDPGDTLTVELTVVDASDAFNAYDAYVTFDNDRLQFLQLDPVADQQGPLMTDACPQTFHVFAVAPDSTRLDVHNGLLCAGATVTGPGVVYRLRFRCREQEGETEIGLAAGTAFFDDGFLVLPVTTHAAQVQIGEVSPTPPAATGAYRLRAAPNPFNPGTEVQLALPRPGVLEVAIYALDGRRVAVLHRGSLAAGEHRWFWNGRDDADRALASGRYLAIARRGSEVLATTSLTLVR